VVVAAQHGVLGQKHDAATTWVEDVTNTSFRICLRELQDFDGLHRDVSVVWELVLKFKIIKKNSAILLA
jgi:hypothetical protein